MFDSTEKNHEVMKPVPEPAGLVEYKMGKQLLVRLRPDTELVQSIAGLAKSKGIEAGSFTAIGALKSARLGYYDLKNRKYREMAVQSHLEMVSCVGNVSVSDGKPFVHAHVVLADEKGSTKAGHLLEGIVFVAEIHLCQIEGPKLERKFDEGTRLWLWEVG